jgi:LPXTG-motif cell wall-anchored protein
VTAPLPSVDTSRAVSPAAAAGIAGLPRTGVATASLAAAALAALLSGTALRLLGRRRLAA